MKIKIGLFLTLSIMAVSLSAADYFYTGLNGADVSSSSAYYKLTKGSINYIWGSQTDYKLYPDSYTETCSYKIADATEMPGINDRVAFCDYTFMSVDSENNVTSEVRSYSQVIFKSSYTIGSFESRTGKIRAYTFGSADASEADFVLKVDKELAFGYSSTTSLVIASDAAQKTFKIDVNGKIATESGNMTTNFGSYSRYFDGIKSGSLNLNEKSFNTYTKEFDVVGDAVIKNTTWTFNVDAFNLDRALIDIGGTLTKETGKIVFDLSNANIDENITGDFDLLSAGGYSGFDLVNANTDFSILSPLTENEPILKWNGNVLQAVFVPEPAEYAAMFGLLAIIAAFMRRRK